MNISLIGVSGHSVKGRFQETDTVKTVCKFLSSSLNVPSQLIRIRNPKDSIFLNDVLKIGDLISKSNKKTEKSYLIYFVLPEIPTHKENKIGQNISLKANDNVKEIIAIPPLIVENIKCLKSKPTLETIRIYKDYIRSFNLPSDFYEKVESLHQMGFEIEESKEALRASEFNVEIAVNRLVNSQNNRRNIDEDTIRIRSSRLVDLLELISVMRNDDGNGDQNHERISRIFRLISRRDEENEDGDNENGENRHANRNELTHFLRRDDSDHNSEDDNSIDNQELNDLMDELNEKLEEINLGDVFDSFSRLIEEARDLIATSKDEQIIDFINYLITFIVQNRAIPKFFQRKIDQLDDYLENENDPDIDHLIRILDNIISHDYENNDNNEEEEEEEEENTDNESLNDDIEID